jgi:hypothetical protein
MIKKHGKKMVFIKVESNDPDYQKYELTQEYMSRNSTLIVSLWDDGWDYNDDWLFKK